MNKIDKWRPIMDHIGCKDEKQIDFLSNIAENYNIYSTQREINVGLFIINILPHMIKYFKTTNLHNIDYSFKEKISNTELLYEIPVNEILSLVDKLYGVDQYEYINRYLFDKINSILDEKFKDITKIEIQNSFLDFVNDGTTIKCFIFCYF